MDRITPNRSSDTQGELQTILNRTSSGMRPQEDKKTPHDSFHGAISAKRPNKRARKECYGHRDISSAKPDIPLCNPLTGVLSVSVMSLHRVTLTWL